MNLSEFFGWEAASRDTIDFKKIYVDVAGDLLAGLVLSEIVYWHLPNKNGESKLRIEKKGLQWIAVKRYEWWDRCRITPDQADRALGLLVKSGLIEKQTFKYDGDPTVHVRIVDEVFLASLEAAINHPAENPYTPEAKEKRGGGRNGSRLQPKTISPTGELDMGKNPKSLTETTTQTTQEERADARAPIDPFGILGEDLKPQEPEKRQRGAKRDLFSIAQALSEVTGRDLNKNRGRLFREASLFEDGDDQKIRSIYGRNGPWYLKDWRGRKGEMPSLEAVRETWGRFASSRTARPGESPEEIAAAYEMMYGEAYQQ